MSNLAQDFDRRYGPWALVCGASDGIGEAFAEQLAAAGLNVALLARRQPLLEKLAQRLQSAHGVQTRVIIADLSTEQALDDIAAATEDLELGLLVYVSGSPTCFSTFLEQEREYWEKLTALNCRTPLQLAWHCGRKMQSRKRGGMIFLSSLASRNGANGTAVYCASKAFDHIFAESLWHELAPHGVDVLCLMAGATDTPTVKQKLKLDFEAMFPGMNMEMPAADVAREGLESLGSGPLRVAGEQNRALYPELEPAARAAMVEGVSEGMSRMQGRDDYRPVYDAENNKLLR